MSLRLREERQRLGLTAVEVARLAGASTVGYRRWEKDRVVPGDVLGALADAGFDVQYVITGVRLPDGVREEVAAYAAPPQDRALAALDLVLEIAAEFGVRDRLSAAQVKVLMGYAYEWAPTRESLRAFFQTAVAPAWAASASPAIATAAGREARGWAATPAATRSLGGIGNAI
jgi:transcriptional regulator with XRE-family HTH domain